MDKSWLEVEMEESLHLIRKKLEEVNNIDAEDLDSEDICDMSRMYKTIHRIMEIKAHLKK